MGEDKKNILTWLFPLLGIIVLLLVTLKRAPETFEEDNTFYSQTEDVDDKLIGYKEVSGIGIEAGKLHALAVGRNDYIYVLVDEKLLILNSNGAEQMAVQLSKAGHCVTVAENGIIFIGFKQHIEVLQNNGEQLATWKKINDKSYITSLALAGKFLFVADAGTRNVWKIDLNGNLSSSIGAENKQEGIPKLIVPSPYFDLASAKDGSLWVVNPGRHKLENFNVDGKLKSMWGESSPDIEGFCGCCNPTHIALLRDGSFVTSEKGHVRVKVYSPKGSFRCFVASEKEFIERTKGLDLAIDSKDNVLVLDPQMKKIRIFDKK